MTSTTVPPVDAKLLHLIQKVITTAPEEEEEETSLSRRPRRRNNHNADYIVTMLRTQHREYLRKDVVRLRQQVQTALLQLQNDQEVDSHRRVNQRKRKSRDSPANGTAENPSRTTVTTTLECHDTPNDEEDDEEDAYDRAVAAQESLRASVDGGGGGLNDALCARYRQVAQLESAATTTTENSSAMAVEPDRAVGPDEAVPATTNEASGPGRKTSKKTPKKKRTGLLASSQASSSTPGNGNSTMPDFLTPVPRPDERYSDLGGMDAIVMEIKQLVEYPMIRPELYQHLGIDPPRGVLLRGPPGTGKSHLANAVAGELGVPFFRVSAPELVSGMSGESEGRIRDLFQAASEVAPALIFLDELDAIAPKRTEAASSRGMEKRMVAQLLLSMDLVRPQNNRNKAAVLVLAASNRPDALDPALRRAGRFDKEILLGVPDEAARERIIRTMTKDMRLSGDFDYKVLARKTPGFVGADIRSLAREAAVLAIDRIFHDVLSEQQEESAPLVIVEDDHCRMSVTPLTPQQMDPLYVTMDDFLKAVPLVQPSSKREGFATVPDVSWDAIGALNNIREELSISVLEPIRNPEKFQALGLTLPAGCLLYGPPGCGKTLLAKAIAHESGANFISVKGPELLDKYVGESERAVRQVFERARASSPCIIFFDELDSLAPKRGSDGGSGGGVSERVVNQLLTELDGLDGRRSVFVIGATNRPELIDSAMLRPGRLDRLLYVPLPTPCDRVSILNALAKGVALADDVDLDAIGRSARANGYSGADCAALLREAGLAVLKEDSASGFVTQPEALRITARHFDLAFKAVMPSVSKKDQARYDRMRDRMARARTRGDVADHGPAPDEAVDEPNSTPTPEAPVST